MKRRRNRGLKTSLQCADCRDEIYGFFSITTILMGAKGGKILITEEEQSLGSRYVLKYSRPMYIVTLVQLCVQNGIYKCRWGFGVEILGLDWFSAP